LRILTVQDSNRVPLTAGDTRALDIVDEVSWIDNEVYDNADMFNTDLVEWQIHVPTTRLYKGNKGHGRSMVHQGRADATGVVAILQAKRR
jgi:hypothetical protein